MNASQRRIAIRALPKQGSKVGYHGKNGLIDVRVGGLLVKDNGKPSLWRIKVTNPATRGRATPKLSQLVY
jgi:hypothetical protein